LPIPIVSKVSARDVQENYLKIKEDVESLLQKELKKIDWKKIGSEAKAADVKNEEEGGGG